MSDSVKMESDGTEDVIQHKTAPRLWWAFVLLAISSILIAVAILWQPTATVFELASPIPTPTWASFPTRVPEAEFNPQPNEQAMAEYYLRVALLTSDLDSAQIQWDNLEQSETLAGQAWYLGGILAIRQQDLSLAEVRILNALRKDAANATYWRALSYVYLRGDAPDASLQCLDMATYYDDTNEMSMQHFDETWSTALNANDTERLLDLAILHVQEMPDSRYNAYYQAKSLMLSREYTRSIYSLIDVISPTGQAPALIWYTLGEAYLEVEAYPQAMKVFEVAASLVARGDNSLSIGLRSPLDELNWKLAQTYLYTNRCAEAESVFRRWENAHQDANVWINRAVVCQTPTPTPTPWILSQQSTPTPTP